MHENLFTDYSRFVKSIAAAPSTDTVSLVTQIESLSLHGANGINIPAFITGAMGLSSETGEIMEVAKKVVFQGKPLNKDTIFHLKREMGDVMWYMVLLCSALDTDMEEIINMNIKKLESRYPNGFEVARSENRAEGDI